MGKASDGDKGVQEVNGLEVTNKANVVFFSDYTYTPVVYGRIHLSS